MEADGASADVNSQDPKYKLLAGFIIGDKVESTISYQCGSGAVSVGDVGIVRGPATGKDKSRVNIDFGQLKGVNMLPTQIKNATLSPNNKSESTASPLR